MAKKCDKRLFLASVPVLFCGLMAVDATAQDVSENKLASVEELTSTSPSYSPVSEILPPAKSGECYAKVSVPAQYRTETVELEVKQATESYKITQAKFNQKTQKVLIQDASNTLKAIQPVMAKEKDVFDVSAARTQWVRNSLEGKIPLSKGEQSDIKSAGIDMASVKPGSCLYEYYQAEKVNEVDSKVLISAATEKLSVTDAVFRDDVESIMVKPTYKRLVEVPAVFKTKKEKVMIEAATSIWKKGTGPIQTIDNLTGEIMCRVDIPAVYKTIEKEIVETAPFVTSVTEAAEKKEIKVKRLVSDAKGVRTPVPAEFKVMKKSEIVAPGEFTWLAKGNKSPAAGEPTGRIACHQAIPAEQIAYERSVVKTAGRFEKTPVAAKHDSIEISELVSDANSSKVSVVGKTSTFEKRVKTQESRFEWMSVLCETNTTGDVISRLQAALKKKGFNVGAVDGKLGRGTLAALEKFQQQNKLAQGGVTMESMKALGVQL